MIYAIIAMVALCAFVSLAVDFGRVQVAKTELMRAADACARAAAAEMSKGSDLPTIQSAAVTIGMANKCDGVALTVDSANDLQFGTWDVNTGTFTPLASSSYTSANAIQVTARRTSARGNPIPLAYGRVIGLANCDVKATAIAYISDPPPGITGLTKFVAHQDLFVASYNPNVWPIPSPYFHNNNATLGGNGTIDLGIGGDLYGDQWIGRRATDLGNGLVHGTKHVMVQDISSPTMPSMTPAANPGGVSSSPTVNGLVLWPGGTYYFTSLTIGDDDIIQFTGPATVYMNGNVTMNDRSRIFTASWKPNTLTWYQAANTTVTMHNDCLLAGQWIAPRANLVANDRLYFYGSMIFQNVTLHDGCQLYWDETLANSNRISSALESIR
jgi:hypothetical protein